MQLLLKTQTEMEELEADDPQVGWLEDKHLLGENGQSTFSPSYSKIIVASNGAMRERHVFNNFMCHF